MRINRTENIINDPKEIKQLIEDHQTVHDYLASLEGQFTGNQEILNIPEAPADRPDNRLVNNFPGYISSVNIGYFMGKPVTYLAKADSGIMMDDIQNIFDYNDEQDENMTLAREASIKGVAYEMLFTDSDSKVRFASIAPENTILLRDNTLESNIIMAIRYWKNGDSGYFADVYDQLNYTRMQLDKKGGTILEGPTPHMFEDVPIVEYPNNEERMGDFERVLSLILAYDKSQSNTANDFDDFTDAYLILRNMSGTEEDEILAMKKHRVLLLGAEDGAEWLTKTMQDTATENYKNRLVDDIHKFSMTPNLSDKSFAHNISGVALEFKLWGLEQAAAQKERKFKKGLQRRIELLCNYTELRGRRYDWRDIDMRFTRNMPRHLPDIVKMVVDLRGILSDETLLSMLPGINDPAEEILKREEEAVDGVDLG